MPTQITIGILVGAGGTGLPGSVGTQSTFLRPNGVDTYLRPDGTSIFVRP